VVVMTMMMAVFSVPSALHRGVITHRAAAGAAVTLAAHRAAAHGVVIAHGAAAH
jgi:hypothetical protein